MFAKARKILFLVYEISSGGSKKIRLERQRNESQRTCKRKEKKEYQKRPNVTSQVVDKFLFFFSFFLVVCRREIEKTKKI